MSYEDNTILKQPLHLISIIIGGVPYRERMNLLYALDPYVDKHIIFTRDNAGEVPAMQKTTIIKPRHRLCGPLFFFWAGILAVLTIWRSHRKTQWVISEHFWWLGILLPRVIFRNRVVTCVSIYAQSRSMYIKKGWMADPYAGILSKAQCSHYAKRYKNQMLANALGLRIAHAFIVNSDGIREDIHQVKPNKAVIVMPTSITLQPVEPKMKNRDNCLRFLYVGVMQPVKGIGTMLEAFLQHSALHPQDKLILIGRCLPVDQVWFEGLLTKYARKSHIEHLSHMPPDKLSKYYSDCDVFLFPSFFEGSPRVVKEAMNSGCPVISSDIPGTRLIDPDQKAIQYFPPGDAVAMALLMGKISKNPTLRNELSQASKTVVAGFCHELIAERLATAYRGLLNKKISAR